MTTDLELGAVASLLELDEFEVVEVERDREKQLRRFTLVPKVTAGLCPHCGGITDERHQCHDWTVLDLPMGGCGTELVVRSWQFRCPACDRFFTPHFTALVAGAHATERLLERLAELAGHGDVSAAARFFGIPEKTAEGWYYGYLKRRESGSDREPVRSLGLDELSLKKDIGNSVAC
jgi:transposase